MPQAKELHDRFETWSGMDHDPVFALDNCCTDKLWLKGGGFKNPTVVGDVFHISKRIINAVSSEKKTLLGYFACELRKCFGSSKPGVFWRGEDIILAIEKVKDKYQREDIALWTEATTRCFENEKEHIINCLALPEVRIANLPLYIFFLKYSNFILISFMYTLCEVCESDHSTPFWKVHFAARNQ